jgi:hypothetical protein
MTTPLTEADVTLIKKVLGDCHLALWFYSAAIRGQAPTANVNNDQNPVNPNRWKLIDTLILKQLQKNGTITDGMTISKAFETYVKSLGSYHNTLTIPVNGDIVKNASPLVAASLRSFFDNAGKINKTDFLVKIPFVPDNNANLLKNLYNNSDNIDESALQESCKHFSLNHTGQGIMVLFSGQKDEQPQPQGTLQGFNKMFPEKLTAQWERNSDGYLTKDGKLMSQSGDCDGLGLSNCNRDIGKCILKGNPAELQACINNYQNDAFMQSQEDLKNMNPTSALAILKTFGVNVDPQTGKADSYYNWLNSATKELQKQMNEKEQLAQYLKGVISFVNVNPAIGNPNTKGLGNIFTSDDQQARELKKIPYILPFGSSVLAAFNSQRAMLGGASWQMQHNITQNPYINARCGGSSTVMNGGSMNELQNQYNSLYARLNEYGISVSEQEKQNVKKAIDDSVDIERKLNKLLSLLSYITQYADYYAGTGVIPSKSTVSLQEINGAEDVLSFLNGQKLDVSNTINANVNQLQVQQRIIEAIFGTKNNQVLSKGDPAINALYHSQA